MSIDIFQQNECKQRIYPISISCKCLSKFQYFGYPHIPTVMLYKMHVCISRICNDVVTGRGGNPIFSQVYRNFLSIFVQRSGFWIHGVAGRPCALRSRKKTIYTPSYQPTPSFNIQSYDELLYFLFCCCCNFTPLIHYRCLRPPRTPHPPANTHCMYSHISYNMTAGNRADIRK